MWDPPAAILLTAAPAGSRTAKGCELLIARSPARKRRKRKQQRTRPLRWILWVRDVQTSNSQRCRAQPVGCIACTQLPIFVVAPAEDTATVAWHRTRVILSSSDCDGGDPCGSENEVASEKKGKLFVQKRENTLLSFSIPQAKRGNCSMMENDMSSRYAPVKRPTKVGLKTFLESPLPS